MLRIYERGRQEWSKVEDLPFLKEGKGGVDIETWLCEISLNILYELSPRYSSSLRHLRIRSWWWRWRSHCSLQYSVKIKPERQMEDDVCASGSCNLEILLKRRWPTKKECPRDDNSPFVVLCFWSKSSFWYWILILFSWAEYCSLYNVCIVGPAS